MIYSHAKLSDKSELEKIWYDVFHDEKDFTEDFFDNFFCPRVCYTARDDDRIVGMLFVLDYTLRCGDTMLKSLYLYGAATLPEYQKRGIFSQLHSFAVIGARLDEADCIITIPQNDDLYDFYKRFGYRASLFRKKIPANTDMKPMGYDEYLKDVSDKNTVIMDKKSFELTLDKGVYSGGFVRDGSIYIPADDKTPDREKSGMILDLSHRSEKQSFGLTFLLD